MFYFGNSFHQINSEMLHIHTPKHQFWILIYFFKIKNLLFPTWILYQPSVKTSESVGQPIGHRDFWTKHAQPLSPWPLPYLPVHPQPHWLVLPRVMSRCVLPTSLFTHMEDWAFSPPVERNNFSLEGPWMNECPILLRVLIPLCLAWLFIYKPVLKGWSLTESISWSAAAPA